MFRHPMFDRRDAKRVRLELSRASGRAEIMDAPGCGPIASVSVIGDDLAVIRAGRADRRDTFVAADLGLWLRIAHHIDFPDYDEGRSLGLADRMPAAEGGGVVGRRGGLGRPCCALSPPSPFRQCAQLAQRIAPRATAPSAATFG
ncbi:MAG: hypothetical protein ACJAVS_001137 [Paracoccaceae bacterium]|jgi:hypothetical protein